MPVGKRVAFLSNRTGSNESYVMQVGDSGIVNIHDSTHPLQLTANSGDNFNPQWKPTP